MAQQSSPQQPTPTSHINHVDDDNESCTHNTSTVETNDSCIIVVLLVCGLPGSGKSTFVNDLVQKYSNNIDTTGSIDDTIPTTTVHTIVYDDLQKEILLRPQQQLQQQQKEDASNTFVDEVPSDIEPTSYSDDPILLQSWRQSRLVALQRLQRLLQDIITVVSTDSNDTQPQHHCHMIVMDDNFYLRSMRKQIYRLCVNQYHHYTTTTNNNNNTNNNVQLYFGTICMDTPLDTCLQRNRQRPEQYKVNHDTAYDGIQLHVTDETIQRMHARFEVPSGCHPVHQPIHWDNAVWTISHTTSTPLLHDPVRDVQQWIRHCIVPTVSTSNPRSNYSNSNDIKVNNRRLLYRILPNTPTNTNDHVPNGPSASMIPNDRHLADVFWRTCVAAVAQQLSSTSYSKIAMANQVRKYCIQQLQLQPQQHVADCNMDTKKQLWWNMFVQGSCTPSVTLSITTSAASTWLTTEEQQILYFYIFPK